MKQKTFPVMSSFVEVEYFGIIIQVPKETTHLSADEDGRLFAYAPCLNFVKTKEYWVCHANTKSFFVGDVDLEGANWEDTLVKI